MLTRRHSEASDATHFSLESLPVSNLTEVSYQILEDACGHFDQTPYKEGGHKLGSGGFGEVFYCHLNLLGTEREVAVKALLSKVGYDDPFCWMVLILCPVCVHRMS